MELKDSYTFVTYGDSITRGIIYDNEKSIYSTLKENFTNLIGNSRKVLFTIQVNLVILLLEA